LYTKFRKCTFNWYMVHSWSIRIFLSKRVCGLYLCV